MKFHKHIRTGGSISPLSKMVLAIFLTFSLATQSATLCAPLDNDYALTALARPNGNVRVYDTDFDNDRRGFESTPGAFDHLALGALAAYRHPGARRLDTSFTSRTLFELYGALRI